MLKHNDLCTGLDYMEETLSYLALKGRYNINAGKLFNLLSATDKLQSICRAHLLRLQTIQDECIIRPVSQQVYHLREIHVHGVWRSINLTSLRDASEDFGIPHFGPLFRMQLDEDSGHQVSGLMLACESECTVRQYTYETPEWPVVLRSTISQPDFCWDSGTWLQGRIYQCQPRDHAWSWYHLGPVYTKWRE